MDFKTIKKHLPYLEGELLNEILKISEEVNIVKVM
jgi:hypothetical protein